MLSVGDEVGLIDGVDFGDNGLKPEVVYNGFIKKVRMYYVYDVTVFHSDGSEMTVRREGRQLRLIRRAKMISIKEGDNVYLKEPVRFGDDDVNAGTISSISSVNAQTGIANISIVYGGTLYTVKRKIDEVSLIPYINSRSLAATPKLTADKVDIGDTVHLDGSLADFVVLDKLEAKSGQMYYGIRPVKEPNKAVAYHHNISLTLVQAAPKFQVNDKVTIPAPLYLPLDKDIVGLISSVATDDKNVYVVSYKNGMVTNFERVHVSKIKKM